MCVHARPLFPGSPSSRRTLCSASPSCSTSSGSLFVRAGRRGWSLIKPHYSTARATEPTTFRRCLPPTAAPRTHAWRRVSAHAPSPISHITLIPFPFPLLLSPPPRFAPPDPSQVPGVAPLRPLSPLRCGGSLWGRCAWAQAYRGVERPDLADARRRLPPLRWGGSLWGFGTGVPACSGRRPVLDMMDTSPTAPWMLVPCSRVIAADFDVLLVHLF